jgi:uncharacterized membrane protein YjjP (DUF1212 family)
MLREEYLERVKFLVQFGKCLHSVGAPAHTLEASMNSLSERLGMKGSFVALPTAIFCSFRFLDEDIARIIRIEPSGINLGMLSQVDQIGQDVINKKINFVEGLRKLEEIFDKPDNSAGWLRVLCFCITSAGILSLLGGSWGDLLASALVGAIIGFISLSKHLGVVAQLYEAVMAIVATGLAYTLSQFSSDINVSMVILASLIMFVPGLYITIAIAEIATQNLTSGTSRLMGGFMILLKLAFGVYIGTQMASLFIIRGENFSFGQIPWWIVFLSVPLTSFMSTVIFKAQWQDAKWITLAGCFGYTLSKVATLFLGAEMGLFIGGMGVGMGANVFARVLGKPSSIFQFPGLILLVPGSVGYRGLSYLYAKDIVMGFDTAFTMLALAFSLVVGVFVGNIVIKPRSSF